MTNYEDIINLPHHTSKKYPRMERSMRACQFAPFAALTGHDDAVKETARLTDNVSELDEYEILKINDKLSKIIENISEHPEVRITYFKPDDKKEGGEYVTIKDRVKKINEYKKTMVFMSGEELDINSILELDLGEFFGEI